MQETEINRYIYFSAKNICTKRRGGKCPRIQRIIALWPLSPTSSLATSIHLPIGLKQTARASRQAIYFKHHACFNKKIFDHLHLSCFIIFIEKLRGIQYFVHFLCILKNFFPEFKKKIPKFAIPKESFASKKKKFDQNESKRFVIRNFSTGQL